MSKLGKSLAAVLLGLVLAGASAIPAFAIEPEVYDSKSEAVEAQTRLLEESNSRPGTYPVEIHYREGDATINTIVHVTVEGEYTVIVEPIGIDAHAVSLTVAEVAGMNDQRWVERADAHAWNMRTLETLPIVAVDSSRVIHESGIYNITFETIEGIKTTVPVLVGGVSGENMLYPADEISDGFNWFEHFGFTILQVFILTMLLLPLLLLFIQFFLSSRLMKELQVITERGEHRK